MFITSRMLASGVYGSLAALSLLPQLAAAATNLRPTIGGTPSTTATVGSTYRFTPTAKDPEGARLYFGGSSLPAWATLDRATGKLTGTPKTAGTYAGISI